MTSIFGTFLTVWAPLVKGEFLHKLFPMVKIHDLRKNGKSGESGRFVLCELKMNIHRLGILWITPVEKPVENVENYELSTGISALSLFAASCGNL